MLYPLYTFIAVRTPIYTHIIHLTHLTLNTPYTPETHHGTVGDDTTEKKETTAYLDKVRHPMDFGTILQKLERGELGDRTVNDEVQLTFANFFNANVVGGGGLECYASYVRELRDQWAIVSPGEEAEAKAEAEAEAKAADIAAEAVTTQKKVEDEVEVVAAAAATVPTAEPVTVEDAEATVDSMDRGGLFGGEEGDRFGDGGVVSSSSSSSSSSSFPLVHSKRITIMERMVSQGGSSQAFRGILDENTADGKEEGDRGE